jgi:DNA-binding response OmpR family regulator
MQQESPLNEILVVDDDPVLIKLLQSTLSEKGFKVTALDNAADGLQFAIKNQPDLIILDVMMPIINGYNFCRLLKNEEGKKHIPIVLLTARDEMDDVEIGMEMGAEAYLTKPVNMGELLRTIQTVSRLGSQNIKK